MGRPSSYSDDLADTICDRITEGESLRSICNSDGIPHIVTVLRWLGNTEHAGFASKYARAREAQSDVMDARILEVADACTNETAQADRVKIDAYKWRAAKLAPKKYGDKLTVDNKSEVTHRYDLDSLSPDKLDALESILADIEGSAGGEIASGPDSVH